MNSHYEKFLSTGAVRCIDDEIPFEIPKGWEWCRLNSLCSIFTGATFRKEETNKNGIGVRILRGGNISPFKLEMKVDDLYISCNKVNESILLRRNDIVTPAVTSLESVGKMARVNEDMGNVTVGGFVFLLRGHLNDDCLSKYLQIAMSSPTAIEFMQSITNKSGQAFYNIGKERLLTAFIPIPPFNEQKKITSITERILPIVEEYEQTQKKLNCFNSEIKGKLRKSILQEAIQGHLVPQIEEEGTAQKLLEQIREEKKRLVKEGKLKKSALSESVIFKGADNRYWEKLSNGAVKCIDDEIPFELPDNWNWTRLDYIAEIYTGNSISESEKKLKYTNVVGREYIGTKDVGFDCTICYNNGVAIPKGFENGFRIAPKFSVLMCVEGGSAGRKIAITNRGVCFGNKLCCFAPYIDMHEYVFYYLQAPVFLEMFNAGKTGIIEGVGVNNLKKLIIPLPPLKEQQRIVTQIERLFKKLQ